MVVWWEHYVWIGPCLAIIGSKSNYSLITSSPLFPNYLNPNFDYSSLFFLPSHLYQLFQIKIPPIKISTIHPTQFSNYLNKPSIAYKPFTCSISMSSDSYFMHLVTSAQKKTDLQVQATRGSVKLLKWPKWTLNSCFNNTLPDIHWYR